MSVDADPGDSALLVVIESKGVIYDEVLHAPLIHMATLELGNHFLLESRNLCGGRGAFNNDLTFRVNDASVNNRHFYL
jgi:hypothetical protein